MNRREAIDRLIATWHQRDNEFCCSDRDQEESEADLRSCLLALGVTEEELKGRVWFQPLV